MHRPLLPLIGTAIAEGVACFFIAAVALAIASTAGFPAEYTGIAYFLVYAAMTSVFRSHTGAMFGPGQAVIRFICYMIGLQKRMYDPLGSRILNKHMQQEHEKNHHYMFFHSWGDVWHAAVDAVGLVLVLGCQLGGFLLGALFLKHFDHTIAVAGIVHVSPFANLAGRNTQSFGLIWGLVSFLLLVQVTVTMNTYKLNWQKKKLHSAIQNPSLAYGVAAGAVAWAAYNFGAGTTGNFSLDLALGIVFNKNLEHLWVSFVGTLLATVTVLLAYLALHGMNWLRHRINHEAREHHGKGIHIPLVDDAAAMLLHSH